MTRWKPSFETSVLCSVHGSFWHSVLLLTPSVTVIYCHLSGWPHAADSFVLKYLFANARALYKTVQFVLLLKPALLPLVLHLRLSPSLTSREMKGQCASFVIGGLGFPDPYSTSYLSGSYTCLKRTLFISIFLWFKLVIFKFCSLTLA